MFRKILVANRGEIALRVIESARRMGVSSVAVYSDADAGARPVAAADEAGRIGPAAATESYLVADRIIGAALETGAEAIHPGYGFLSENPEFVEEVEAAGLTFIGPSAEAIRAMGLKDAAKALMQTSGIPVVPGYHGDNQEAGFLQAEAEKVGYPVLIKARAGGGGKGMRLVGVPGDFAEALAAAQREARASFGDAACLIEKFIAKPRHIEVQVFGDNHGNVVHLFERDCSLQRRHQKVIEEAPAPDMPPEVRAAMGKAAVNAAKAIGYSGAGTVEFIADGTGPLRPDGFWFMEMNTRLQVEHPVTEAITGLDLVALQLEVASGAPLPFSQDDLAIDGHAIEARIYAEDVPSGFLPATGTIAHMKTPDATAFSMGDVRIDSGVSCGDTISPHYDPMIAKLIVKGANRHHALLRMERALADFQIAGFATNLSFLSRLIRHPDFTDGQFDTGVIARAGTALTNDPPPTSLNIALAVLASAGLLGKAALARELSGWRHWQSGRCHAQIQSGTTAIEADISVLGQGGFAVDLPDAQLSLEVSTDSDGRRVILDGQRITAHVVTEKAKIFVIANGQTNSFTALDPLAADTHAASGDTITAPMPGLVKDVLCAAGDTVAQGQSLLILEAMKMEHVLRAPRDGVIAAMSAMTGDQVEGGTLLVQLETIDG